MVVVFILFNQIRIILMDKITSKNPAGDVGYGGDVHPCRDVE